MAKHAVSLCRLHNHVQSASKFRYFFTISYIGKLNINLFEYRTYFSSDNPICSSCFVKKHVCFDCAQTASTTVKENFNNKKIAKQASRPFYDPKNGRGNGDDSNDEDIQHRALCRNSVLTDKITTSSIMVDEIETIATSSMIVDNVFLSLSSDVAANSSSSWGGNDESDEEIITSSMNVGKVVSSVSYDVATNSSSSWGGNDEIDEEITSSSITVGDTVSSVSSDVAENSSASSGGN